MSFFASEKNPGNSENTSSLDIYEKTRSQFSVHIVKVTNFGSLGSKDVIEIDQIKSTKKHEG